MLCNLVGWTVPWVEPECCSSRIGFKQPSGSGGFGAPQVVRAIGRPGRSSATRRDQRASRADEQGFRPAQGLPGENAEFIQEGNHRHQREEAGFLLERRGRGAQGGRDRLPRARAVLAMRGAELMKDGAETGSLPGVQVVIGERITDGRGVGPPTAPAGEGRGGPAIIRLTCEVQPLTNPLGQWAAGRTSAER